MVNPPACSSTTTYAAGISSSSCTSPFEQIMSMDAVSSIVLEYLAVNPNQNNIYHRFSGLLEDSSMDEQRFQSLHHGQTRDAFLGAMRTFAYPAPKSSPLSQQREEDLSDESPGGRRRTRFGGWFSKPTKSMTTRDADNITTVPRSRMQDVLALCSVNRSIRTSIGESFFWEARFVMHFGCQIVARRESDDDGGTSETTDDNNRLSVEAEEASLARPMLLQQFAFRMKSRFSFSSSSSTLLPIPQRNSVTRPSSSSSTSSSSWLSSLCAFIGAPKGTTQRMEFFQRSLEQFSEHKNEDEEEEERLPRQQQRRSRIFDPNARIVLVASLKDCTYEMTDFLRLAVSACSETNDVCPSDVSIQTHRVFVHDTDITMHVTTCVVPYSPEPPCCGGGSVQQQEEDFDEDVSIFDVPVSTTKTMNISKDKSVKKKKKPNRTVLHFVGFQLGPMNNVKLEEIVGSDIWCVVYLLDAKHVFADTDVSCPTSMSSPTELKRVELIELTHALGVHETLRRMDAHVFCFGSGMGAEVNAAPSLSDMQRYLMELRRMAWDNYWSSAAAASAARGQPLAGEVATPSLDVSFSCLALPATIRRAMSRVVYC